VAGGKVAGEYLPRWFSEHGIAPAAGQRAPAGGVTVRRSLHAMSPEAQYLYDLARASDAPRPRRLRS
jgi:hypothetical protein